MENSKIKKVYKTIMLIIVVTLVTFIVTSTIMYKKLGKTAKYSNILGVNNKLLTKIYTANKIINSKYISNNIDEDALIDGAIKGYINGLEDEYTEYFTKEEMDEFRQDVEGNYVGIGIYMYHNTKDNTIIVLYPIENSPAEVSGVKTGDIITKVDGVEYTGDDFDKISSYIKGKQGTYVKLEIERNGERIELDIERKNIDMYPIKSEILENNIGYIELQTFDNNSAKEFKEAYENLSKNNINGLIIDLRNNGGGIVDEALDIASYITDKDDVLLITTDKNGNDEIEKNNKNPIIKIPVVVLVNENSASASEILAAALQENGKAKIIGQKTYGKGVIQQLIELSDGSGIKITTSEYFTPNRNKINKIGINPDIEVTLPETENIYSIERKDDTQLKEAISNLIK